MSTAEDDLILRVRALGEEMLDTIAAARAQRSEREARMEKALRRIRDINLGPDQASSEWRCREVEAIAEEGLKP